MEDEVAKDWGIDPVRWRALPFDDRARMTAGRLFHTTIEKYREEWREKKHKEKEKGVNPYKAMKAQMGLD